MRDSNISMIMISQMRSYTVKDRVYKKSSTCKAILIYECPIY